MTEVVSAAFALYPLLLSGIALIWQLRIRNRSGPGWVVSTLACGSIIAFTFITGPWAFTSYYLRYVFLSLFAVAAIFSYYGTKSGAPNPTMHKGRVASPSILILLLFAFLDALAIASYYPSQQTLSVTFPLRSGTYYILQGGASIVTNPFHSLGSNKLALDIVELNSLGNRANGIAPTDLNAYKIFGEILYSLCQGNIIKVRDGLSDNTPGSPDTEQPEGNYIMLRCGEVDILVAHLRRGSIRVAPGQAVTAKQPLAEVGNSGNTLEPHLHVEAMKGGNAIGLRFDAQSLAINSIMTRM